MCHCAILQLGMPGQAITAIWGLLGPLSETCRGSSSWRPPSEFLEVIALLHPYLVQVIVICNLWVLEPCIWALGLIIPPTGPAIQLWVLLCTVWRGCSYWCCSWVYLVSFTFSKGFAATRPAAFRSSPS